MRIGIMGGTFDPIHTGHLVAGECARSACGLDEVWFMPANVPPHKPNAPKASAAQRWEMVCRAVADNPAFRPLDFELRKGGVSYSIDTIKLLQQQHPEHRFQYIIGADMVEYLPEWHKIEEIMGLIGFIGLQRPGYELDLDALPAYIRSGVSIAPMPLLDISSTDIRGRRKDGRSIRYLVPAPVHDYIEGNDLYGP
ncbi:nicotinate-nucleotide adenylyltransferase [Paenibacillus lutrae]|uniref:Probable nicotinate-nucleotide adenylyltransferase n=1 Tax=Paenibacillus lutrae TaxID=2078573 RepID=A0A7X3JYY1_9BACL|nr:nicotinate-nucleotide adenylyltransferase [Paenibacillus lutrae]MVO99496.1 nicotinate-nucleotide adenylyltransferase [Paenibacillus lutrae]